jgi:hypothetical protein
MRKIFLSPILWGALLIFGGVIILLDNLGVIRFGDLFWALLSGLGAFFFLSFYFENRHNWWSLIPGISLVGVTLGVLFNSLIPGWTESLSGLIFLGSIGVSFFCVYLISKSNWWAIIPGGVLLTLGIVAGVEPYLKGDSGGGGVFFLGLGLTFFLVAVLPTPVGNMSWAWIPAGILGLLGIFILALEESAMIYIGSAALIFVGVVLVIRALRSQKG